MKCFYLQTIHPFELQSTRNALAAVAVSTAAMAQVTLSGNLGFAYQQTSAAGSKGGLAVTDGQLAVTATEDLGQGMKAIARSNITARGRDTTGTRDASLTLTGGFGTVTIGAIELANGIIGRGFGGAPVSLADGFDGKVLAGGNNADFISYTSPAINGFTIAAVRADNIKSSSFGDVGPGTGIGNLQANVIGVSYAAGPLSAGVDVTAYTATSGDSVNDRTRVSVDYNFGVAKVGYGLQTQKGTDDQTAMGVSVPLGAITLGAVYAENGAKKGTAYGATYAFSKTTNLNVSYGSHVESAGGADLDQYRVRLLKSF